MHKYLSFSLLIIEILFQSALADFSVSDNVIESNLLLNQGIEYYKSGHFDNAISSWQQALNKIDSTQQPKLAADTHLGVAAACQAMGLYQQGLNALNTALPLIEKSEDINLHSKWFNQLGNLYLASGHKDKAIRNLKKAVDKARETYQPILLANSLNNYANALWIAGFESDAVDIYQESLALSDSNKKWALASQTTINILKIKIMQNKLEAIDTDLQYAVSCIEKMPENYEKTNNLVALSLSVLKLYKKDPSREQLLLIANDWLKQAVAIAKKSNNSRLLSFSLGYQAQLYENQQRYDEASYLTRQALFFAQQVQAADIEYLWQWQQGRLLNAQNKLNEATQAYRTAVRTLTPIRKELSNGYRRSTEFFQEQIKPIYSELVNLLLIQASNTSNDDQYRQLLFETRNVIEALKTAELEDYFRDECVIATKESERTLDNISLKTVVLYPIILPDRLELLISLPTNANNKTNIQHRTIPITSKKFNSTAYKFRELAQDSTNNHYIPYAQRLYKWLIEPIEPSLVKYNIDTIIMVPDGSLRTIPLAALRDKSKFLIEKYALGITPSLTLTDPEVLSFKKRQVLLTGISEAVQGYPSLPYVSEELVNIQNHIGGTILENKENTANNLSKALRSTEYSIIHMATHGIFGETPEKSFLLTYDSQITMNDLESLLKISQFRENNVELLTMSACETALGNDRAALGLAGIAIKASARSAIASLWLVQDLATSKLMTEFYRHLKKDTKTSKAQALKNAQNQLISQLNYQHPANWAPFLLIGSWL